MVHVTGQSPSQPSPQPSPGAGRASGPDAGGGPGNSGSPDGPRELAPRANLTTAENPWPLRLLSSKIDQYVARMSQVWVEGQVIQLNRRPGAGMAFLTLRDTDADISMSVSIYARVLDAVLARTGAELGEGARESMDGVSFRHGSDATRASADAGAAAPRSRDSRRPRLGHEPWPGQGRVTAGSRPGRNRATAETEAGRSRGRPPYRWGQTPS